MKKLLFGATVSLLALVMFIPVYGEITSWTWIGTTYTGPDAYYGRSVNAYETGMTAVLAVTVRNDEAFRINITNVEINMDWGSTYTSTQVNATNPETLESNEVRTFFISFGVPSTSVASNLYVHSYTIVTDYSYLNPANLSETLTDDYDRFGSEFVVYSEEQADAMDLSRIISGFGPPSGGWRSAKARILWNKVSNETGSGAEYYRQGQFNEAEQRFSMALDYIDQAWDAEEAYLTVLEELQIQEVEASIRSLDAMTSFLNGLSVMWMLFGIGGVLFGIGYVIKWLAHVRMHSKPTETPAK